MCWVVVFIKVLIHMPLKLHSYFRSSCSWRVRIALNLLKVPYEIVPINLLKSEQLSSSYKSINPLGTVPAIQLESGDIIWQSLAIIDYLDIDQKLLPKERLARAKCWEITNTICSEIQPLQNLSVLGSVERIAGKEARSAWAVHHNKSKLKIIEEALISRGSEYAIGNMITLADICMVPQLYSAKRFGIDVESEFPKMMKIARNLEMVPAFQRAHPHNQPDCPEDIRVLGDRF